MLGRQVPVWNTMLEWMPGMLGARIVLVAQRACELLSSFDRERQGRISRKGRGPNRPGLMPDYVLVCKGKP